MDSALEWVALQVTLEIYRGQDIPGFFGVGWYAWNMRTAKLEALDYPATEGVILRFNAFIDEIGGWSDSSLSIE